MENNPTNPQAGAINSGTTATSASAQSKAMPNVGATNPKFKLSINCSIRRRPSLIGLPGTDPNDRIYKIGASLDARTRKNLKGVDGAVEALFMPSIIGTNIADNSFQDKVNEYWGNIGVFIPADESFLREEVRGKVLKIDYEVTGQALKERIDGQTDIEAKVELIKEGLANKVVTVEYSHVPDFILLCYCLKYSKVAKDFTYLDKSPKILFYIYNKASAIKAKLNTIDLRNKAIKVFTELANDENKINQLLVMFNKLPNEYDTLDDKLIALDAEYNTSNLNMEKFVKFAEDDQLDIKYLITYAVKKGKLNNPSNTEAYYYNQVLLGRTLQEAVLYLSDTGNTDAVTIKDTLKREIKD